MRFFPPFPAWCHCPSTSEGLWEPQLGLGGFSGRVGDAGSEASPSSSSLLLPGARLRTVCFLFPVGDSPFTLLLSLLAWLS